MVRIRLRRVGSRHQPSYRMVVADEESPRDGRFLEIVGHYNPRTVPASIDIEEARIFYWLAQGAQPSESARRVLTSSGSWARWERRKSGESLESLLAEAKASAVPVDPRTATSAGSGSRPSKKSRARAEAQATSEAGPAEG